jgi:hypothetical protein
MAAKKRDKQKQKVKAPVRQPLRPGRAAPRRPNWLFSVATWLAAYTLATNALPAANQ